jgi:hypothetical protein
MSDTYGQTSSTPFAQYDPDTQSWKTSAVTSLWALPMSSLTLPKSGGLVNGELIERPMLALPTDVSDSSSLPTPTAADGTKMSSNPATSARRMEKGNQASLTDIVQTQMLPSDYLLPTPMARDYKEQHLYDGTTLGTVGRKAGVLSRRLALLPTPTTQETHTGPSQRDRNTVPLNQLVVDLLPTPRSRLEGNQHYKGRDKGNLEDIPELFGESTPPQSDDGSLF